MRTQVHNAWLCALVASCVVFDWPAVAHEGHQPLPTKGVQVNFETGQVTLSAQASTALGLQSAEVVVGKVAATINVYAESMTPWQAKAFGSAQIAGRITQLLVRPGEQVQKNQVVAELSSRELELIRLDYLQAKNELALNLKLLAMTRTSAEAGAIPMQRLLDVENAIEQSQNLLEIAKLRARTLGVAIDDSRFDESQLLLHPIRSPIAGRILHSDLAEGKYVEAFEHLFEIVNTDEVWIRLQILEKDLINAKIGNRVSVELPGLAQPVEGIIDRMDVGLDPKAQVGSAWVTLTQTAVVPGLAGHATIYLSELPEKLTVPQEAVYSDGLQNYVFVEEAATRTTAEYRKQSIRLGTRRLVNEQRLVEVLQGDIFPGDRVVVSGGHELSSLFFLGVLKLSSSEQQRLGILVEPATLREIPETLHLPGLIALPPANRSVLTSQLDGTVHSHSLSPGQSVRAGDKLLELVSPDFLKLQLELISTSLDAALSRRRADRLEGVKGDAISLRMVLETRTQAEQLEMRAQSIRRQLAMLGLLDHEIESIVNERDILEYLPVRATILGRIASSVVTLGETVLANQPLLEIQNLESVWIEAHMPTQVKHPVLEGARGVASLVANPELRLPVVVSRIGPTVNESTRTRRIWLTPTPNSVAQSDVPELRFGTLVRVSVPMGRAPTSLAIPSTAILRDGSYHFSFVQQSDGHIERRRLSIGRSDGQFTEVTAGISPGELVITVGARELQTVFASLR